MAARYPMLRTSERRAFKRCPQRWWWEYRDGYKMAGPPSDALWFGIGWHEVMAHWYCGPGKKRGRSPLKVWREYCGDEARKVRTLSDEGGGDPDKYEDAQALGEAMLAHYFEVYGRDESWWVVTAEMPFQVIIRDPKTQRILVQYNGTYDLVYIDEVEEAFWLAEHKTAKSIRTLHLARDDQGGSYWATATPVLRSRNLIGPNDELAGIMYNYVHKGKPDARPRDAEGSATNKPTKAHFVKALIDVDGWTEEQLERKSFQALKDIAAANMLLVLGDPSKVQPPKLLVREPIYRYPRERNMQIQHIRAEVKAMDAMRSGRQPLFKNPTTDCEWDCQFKAMCSLHERGEDWKDFAQTVYQVVDPYADHRKSAAEGED